MEFNERQIEIIRLINRLKQLNVNDLSARFKISGVTIRKDLDELQSIGVLKRTHGGAIIAENIEKTITMEKKLQENIEMKISIARTALNLIFDCETIALDAGSTNLEIAKLIKNTHIKIITNSLLVINELQERESGTLIAVGGIWRKASDCFIGPQAVNFLEHLNVDIVFIGATGIDIRTGFTCQNSIEAELKAKFLSIATRKFIVADSTKYGYSAFQTYCNFNDVDALITDDKLPLEARNELANVGLHIITAKTNFKNNASVEELKVNQNLI